MVSEAHFTTEFLMDIICDRGSSSLISILEFTCLPSTQFLYRLLRFKISRTLIIRQMQTKTTMRYHLIPVRMTINKKSTNNKYWQVCRKKRETCYIVGGNINWCSHYGKYRSFLKKLKIELPYDLAIPLLGKHLEKSNCLIQKDTYL